MYELSICVPVFNRPESLRLLLSSICLSSETDRVQICISDNNYKEICNEDVVKEFSGRLKIKYIRNNKNIGMVKNILNVIDMAEGKYIWLMGDDDYILGEKLGGLLEFLSHKDIDWLVLPYVYMSNDYQYVYNTPFDSNILGRIFSFNDFVSEYLWLTGFIGANLFKKDIGRFFSEEESAIINDSYFPHVAFLGLSCGKGVRVEVYVEEMSFNRSEDQTTTTWSDKYFEIYWGWEDMLGRIALLTSNEAFNNSITTSQRLFNHRAVSWVLSRKADGLYNYAIFKKFYSKIDRSYLYLLVLLVPSFVARTMKFMLKNMPRAFTRRGTNIKGNV